MRYESKSLKKNLLDTAGDDNVAIIERGFLS